jgi:hypothetical protein
MSPRRKKMGGLRNKADSKLFSRRGFEGEFEEFPE